MCRAVREPVTAPVVLHTMYWARYCTLMATFAHPSIHRPYWRRDALKMIETIMLWTGQAPAAHREMHHARELVLAGLADPSNRMFGDARFCISRAIDSFRSTAEEWAEV